MPFLILDEVKVHRTSSWKSDKMAKAVENWQAKLDKILHEKNAFTDLLEKVETKTGVRRLYLVLGKLNSMIIFIFKWRLLTLLQIYCNIVNIF